jgi:putative ABC transport system ATP-binding protein
VALLGESGVGKSTLLNCIAGLEHADRGERAHRRPPLAGSTTTAAPRLRREQLGFVFQAFHVLPHLTVAENVSLPLRLLGRADARVAPAAAVGLDGLGGAIRRSCRAGSCSAWPSRARWCTRRR